MMKFHYLFHAIVYYGAWFLGLKLAADGDVWQSSLVIIVCVFLQVGWQYQIQHHTRGLWYLMGLIVIISTVVDSLLVFNGLVIYKANPFAPYLTSPWMIAIWVSFAVTDICHNSTHSSLIKKLFYPLKIQNFNRSFAKS